MARATKPATTALVPWKDELASLAKQVAATEKPSGGKKISTNGGKLSFGGSVFPDNEVDVVVLGFAFENAYYEGAYDKDNPQPPSCFSIAVAERPESEDEMAPHDNSYEKQCKDCLGCEFNKFGSADQGKGKKCKNTRKLALVMADDLDDLAEAEIATLSVSPTNIAAWKGYVSKLSSALGLPPFGMVTRVKLDGYALSFSPVEGGQIEFDQAKWEAMKAKIDEAKKILLTPYDKFDPDAAPKAAPARAASARSARFTGAAAAPAKATPVRGRR